MSITRKNYERYFLEYLEGLLDPALMEELSEFLRQNPDLNAELEDFESLKLQADTIHFNEKNQLKKSTLTSGIIHDQNFDQLCIAKIEEDLSPVEEKVLNQILMEDPERKKDLEIFKKTKLQPKPVIFPDKRTLKRRTPVFLRPVPRYAISAAASILLIIAFSFILVKIRTPRNKQAEANLPETEERTDDTMIEPGMDSPDNISESELIQETTEKQPATKSEKKVNIPVIAIHSSVPEEGQSVLINETPSNGVENFRPGMSQLEMKDIKELKIPSGEIVMAMKTISIEEKASDDYLTFKELLVHRIKGKEIRNQVSDEETDKLTFLDIANAGVRGISRIPGVNMKMDRTYDQNGELSSYAFTSKNLSFTRDVKNKGSL